MCESVLVQLFAIDEKNIVYCEEQTFAAMSEQSKAARQELEALQRNGKIIINLNSLSADDLQKLEDMVSYDIEGLSEQKKDATAWHIILWKIRDLKDKKRAENLTP
ncbi:MAG: hypothetical protein K2J20_04400 [Bacilli bacterium]|nr:hypothetical protein [Bacilli bacterium]